jgi:hypothetical protein
VIVCGLDGVGLRTVEQLRLAEVAVVVLDDEPDQRMAVLVKGWGWGYMSATATQTRFCTPPASPERAPSSAPRLPTWGAKY